MSPEKGARQEPPPPMEQAPDLSKVLSLKEEAPTDRVGDQTFPIFPKF